MLMESAQVYSLVQQKANLLVIRENAELKSISRNQERLAQAATRDSTAMTVIAAVTMFFLPGTFTAVSLRQNWHFFEGTKLMYWFQTLFSTTFFDFRIANDEHIVSSWLWLYFATTCGLSLVTFTLWRVWLRRALGTRNTVDSSITS